MWILEENLSSLENWLSFGGGSRNVQKFQRRSSTPLALQRSKGATSSQKQKSQCRNAKASAPQHWEGTNSSSCSAAALIAQRCSAEKPPFPAETMPQR
ncbi:hypothetical protein QUC31_006917 [Theobroma cacao]